MTLAVLILASLTASTLSGAIGMGGGVVLLAVMAKAKNGGQPTRGPFRSRERRRLEYNAASAAVINQ